MFKRPMSYGVLASFAVVMVVILMLNDPARKQADLLTFRATQQALMERVLFPQFTSSAQINGIGVLDVTTEKGILVVRDSTGLWYAPAITNTQANIPADQVDQSTVEKAAAAILSFSAQQWFDATPENFKIFGLQPEPAYRLRFRASDAQNRVYESVLDVGDTNPNHVAYYVYVNVASGQNQRIYLIDKQTVDMVLTMLTGSIQATPTLDALPTASEAVTPVP